MRFTLEATASEFPEKGPALIERLAKALDPVSPQLADSIRQALPEKERESRYPVLQALKDKATAIYRDQLKLMVDEILEVLQETPEELRLNKAGPYIGPLGGQWANPQHTIHWEPENPAHTGSLWDAIEAAGVKIKPHYTDFNKLVLKAPKEMAGKLEQLREAGHLPDAVIMSEYYAILPISKNFYEHIAKKTAPSALPTPPPKKESLPPQVQEAIAAPSKPVEPQSVPAYGKHTWAPHKTVAEAREWAKQFGVDVAYQDLNTANAVNQALSGQHPWVLAHIQFVGGTKDLHAWAAGHSDIAHKAKYASAHPADLAKFSLGMGTVAEAHPIGQKPYTLSVVAINDGWDTEAKYTSHGKEKSGFSRCTTLTDTLRHECGHVEGFVLRHVRPFGAKGPSAWDIWKKHCAQALKSNSKQVEKEISEYGTINPHECWAEIAVMRRRGMKLPEWVETAIAEMRIDYKPWDQMAPAAIWGK